MTTLFEALLATLRALGALHEGAATGGSATTIVDSTLPLLGFNQDDHFNGGTALVVYDAGGAGASPQGKSRVISDYAGASGTLTFVTVTDAVVAGDRYGAAANRFPRDAVVGKINEALLDVGDLPTVDTTSLDTAENVTEYALPAAAKRDLREVWLATATAAPFLWEPVTGWRVEASAAGEAGNLIFDYVPPAGYAIKLVYLAPHPYVQADADEISDLVDVERLGVEAARRAARDRLQGAGAGDKALIDLINDLDRRAGLLAGQRPVRRPNSAVTHFPFTAPTW